MLAKLPSVSLSVPSPRSTEALEAASTERDGVGARAADQRLDVRDRSRCWRSRRGQLVGAGAEVDALRADERRAERERVGAEPPTSVSTFEIVAVLAKLPSVSLSVPEPRSIVAFEAQRRERDRVGARAADDALDVRDRRRVGEVAEASRVSAPVPRSIETFETCVAERDGVGAGAADQRLDVRDRARVLEVAERRACRCRSRDRCCWPCLSAAPSVTVSAASRRRGSRRWRPSACWRSCRASACRCRRRGRPSRSRAGSTSVMVSAPVPPIRVSTFETEAGVGAVASVSLSVPEPRSMVSEPESAAPSVMRIGCASRRRASRRSRSSPCWRSRRASACRCRSRDRS